MDWIYLAQDREEGNIVLNRGISSEAYNLQAASCRQLVVCLVVA
jgi:hypothetical protein